MSNAEELRGERGGLGRSKMIPFCFLRLLLGFDEKLLAMTGYLDLKLHERKGD